MGNPLGLTETVTDGIVSATGRAVSKGLGSSAILISAIQTSAAINPGKRVSSPPRTGPQPLRPRASRR